MKKNYLILIMLAHIITCVNAQQTGNCINADFELGDFSYWTGSTGSCCPVNTNIPGIVTGRHTIMSGPGDDPNSLGHIPLVPPGGGIYTARLGNSNVGAEAEQLSYAFTVSADNALFVYRYAVVLQDPGHTPSQQPRFSIRVFDQSGAAINCGTYDVVSGANIPGFINNGMLRIKPWASVGIELSSYVGQTVTIEFTTADCGAGGHFGYAYLECHAYPFQLTSAFCAGANSTALSAPEGFAAYLWSNGDTLPSIVVPNPASGTTYTCTMTSVTGCQVTLSTVLIPEILSAAFSLTDSCVHEVKFIDVSHVISGSPINRWLWNFGDGDTSTQSSPAHPYALAGLYTVHLIAINTIGCRDTIIKTITVHEKPSAAFVSDTTEGCEPLNVQFTDVSASTDGTVAVWQWVLGNNITSSSQQPSATYTAGIYTISLVATTTMGCSDTIKYNNLITSHPAVTADFKFTPDKASDFVPFISFTDKSQKAQYWFWDFGDSTYSDENSPLHTYHNPGFYKVIQIATSQFGCADTIEKTLEYVSGSAFYFPNAFSPNGDGKNDDFKGVGFGIKDFKLAVYNRYGQIIYSTNSEGKSWDGTYKNTPVQSGTYMYKANIIDRKNKLHNMEGTVAVIR